MSSQRKPTSQRISEINHQAADRLKELRWALMNETGLRAATTETVLSCQLAMLGYEAPFKIHASRALENGVNPLELQALILVGLGATMLPYECGRALEWLDQVIAERGGSD